MTPFGPPRTLSFSSSPSEVPLSSGAYADANDRLKHLHVIARLADETGRQVTEIRSLYEEILVEMRATAMVQDYLPLLVSKRVKRILKK